MENLFKLIDDLISYEKNRGIIFTDDGFPTFTKEMFYTNPINKSFPYDHRNEASPNDSINFFSHDINMYRKLNIKKLEKVANNLTFYQAFIGFDLSIFIDISMHNQKFIILANLVIDIFFILHGNKMIPNLRYSTYDYFYLFNEAKIVCCGVVGNVYRKAIKASNKELITNYADSHKEQIILLYGFINIDKPNTIQIEKYKRKEIYRAYI